MRTRLNVFESGAAEAVKWYALAVRSMQNKPIADPTSWRYQAAIHEYIDGSDPLAVEGEALPSSQEQDRFWNQCQHGSWYFLPWHRMYLLHFERIVAAEVLKQKGPADWALPYWNYGKNESSRLLPPAFRAPKMPDGSNNPLFVAQRREGVNAGNQFAQARDVNMRPALFEPDFDIPSVGGTSGFGGPITEFEHGGSVAGTLDALPHGSMHVAVGGTGPRAGWMSSFNTAALDPIFWLHHANIDRLWEVWLKRDTSHANPNTNDWLRSVAFEFKDALGKIVSMTPADVLDTSAASLSYVYDDTSDPFAAVPAVAAAARIAMPKKQRPEAEMVGATSQPFDLGDAPTHTVVPTVQPRVAARTGTAAMAATPPRVFLNIENISSGNIAPAYDVYVNVPDGAHPKQHEDLFVGRLSMFGIVEASRPSKRHPGSGLHYVLDVTDIYERLSKLSAWDPSKLRVSFLPAEPTGGAKIRVGRVSLYFG
jgi:tyrosinase